MSDPRPALTPPELREIGLRNRGNADVITLLWEVKRLRDELEVRRQEGFRDYRIISRCYQIARSLPRQSGLLGTLIDDLIQKLEGHPVKAFYDGFKEDMRKAKR